MCAKPQDDYSIDYRTIIDWDRGINNSIPEVTSRCIYHDAIVKNEIGTLVAILEAY